MTGTTEVENTQQVSELFEAYAEFVNNYQSKGAPGTAKPGALFFGKRLKKTNVREKRKIVFLHVQNTKVLVMRTI